VRGEERRGENKWEREVTGRRETTFDSIV